MKEIIIVVSVLVILFTFTCLDASRYLNEALEHYNRGNYDDAEIFIKRAISSRGQRNPEIFFWASRIALAQNKQNDAVRNLHLYLDFSEVQNRDFALELLQTLTDNNRVFKDVYIQRMPHYFGSMNSDFAPVLKPDGNKIYFTSQREALSHKDNIWKAEKLAGVWGKPKEVRSLNNNNNQSAGSFSNDGMTIYLSGRYSRDILSSGIYQSELVNKKWSKPEIIDVVSSDYHDYSPFVWNDRVLVFASEREENIGRTDLYISEKKNGVWQKPINLGPMINTKGNEISPFIDQSGRRLFFSSDVHPGLGGYDIFVSYKTGSDWTSWSKPVNLGSPINSGFHDRFFTMIPNSNQALFSSNRDSDFEENIFMAIFTEVEAEEIVFNVFGYVKDEHDVPIQTEVNFTYELNLEEVKKVVETDYSGFYEVVLPAQGKSFSYLVNEKGYYIQRGEINYDKESKIENNIILKAMEVEAVFVFDNILFDFDSDVIRRVSFTIVDELAISLLNNPDLTVELRGYTCNIGNPGYNKRLSLRRANSIKKYLLEKGVDEHRILTVGFGEENPVKSNETEEGREKNRRVEMEIISK